ncbi:MAG: molybdopterin-dependent oxidoreductase [Verrucomicrobia bacterium]|nr:molybdopterin-dependent oxidoreductase [Verrucomicrobiota bacterium]MCH8528054.1 molybdopterin-dependent oxidoreductase [Kiritimatiellia bacterium]
MSIEQTKTICPYCGVGCGVLATKDGEGRLEVEGIPDYPVNRGKLCSKGRYLHHAAADRDHRLLHPAFRDRDSDSGEYSEVSWDTAMARLTDTVRRAQAEHGPDAVAFYVSGQCLTEEYYLANKIVKGFLGTNNIDTNSRLCMSSAVMGYKETLGDDLVPACYEDLDHCDCFLVAGANPSWCHPILWRRVEARKQAKPDTKIIVVDPRRTETCAFADLHLQLLPGTDIVLFNAIAALLVEWGEIDHDFITNHTEGFERLKAELERVPLPERARVCGLNPLDIVQAASWIGKSPTFMSLWTMGLNQSRMGTDKNVALIQLNLLRGAIGRPGCGPLSLTGQPNAMGGREVGGMATLLAAHHDPANPAHRAKVAGHWQSPPLSGRPGLTATEIVEALEAGSLKVLWIIATNPAVSLPDQTRWEAAVAKADLVVVQDFSNRADTLRFADVILPAATWLEKEGTMTNSERRVARVRKLIDPPGEARPDADILLDFARRMGWEQAFNYTGPAEIFAEAAALTRGTAIDISGLSYERIDRELSVQWPCPDEGDGSARLFTDHRFATPNGRARLKPVPDAVPSPGPCAEYPLLLTTGRIRDQWHTMTRTGGVRRLNLQQDHPALDLHPDDIRRHGLEEGWPAEVRSAGGSLILRVRATEGLRPGVAFIPMHWGRGSAEGRGLVNRLLSVHTDPRSKQPDFKYTPVRVLRPVKPRERIVIVGAGAGALQFLTRYRQYNQTDEITVIGLEPRGFYNRILLPDYLTGERTWDSLETLQREAENKLKFHFVQGVSVTGIDRERRVVLRDDGEETPYDKLILATGSGPFVPPGVPVHLPRVFTMRTREDADRARAAIQPGTRVLIMGGGLLGIELAAALDAGAVKCTVVNLTARLMQIQLDETAGTLLRQELEERGIRVICEDSLAEYHTDADGAFIGAITQKGERIDAEVLFVAVGTRPNIAYLKDSGIDIKRGVCVNDHLQTSDPDIYALGEIAEHRGMLYGITAGAQEQANVAARHLAGDVWSGYEGSTLFNILKIHGRDVRSAGISEFPAGSENDPAWEDVVFADKRRRIYQRCILHNRRLVGAQFVGDASPWDECKRHIDSRLELEQERDTLLRPAAAEERPPVLGRLVCTCNQVGETNLHNAIRDGATDLETLCTKTKAGTGCGSCRPEVQMILEKNHRADHAAV